MEAHPIVNGRSRGEGAMTTTREVGLSHEAAGFSIAGAAAITIAVVRVADGAVATAVAATTAVRTSYERRSDYYGSRALRHT